MVHIPLGTGVSSANVVLDPTSMYAYVTDEANDTVIEIDAMTDAVKVVFSLGADHGTRGIRFCGGQLWIANTRAKSVSILDPMTGKVEDLALGGVAIQTACTPDNKYAFATLYDTKEVVRINVATRERPLGI